MKKIIFFTGSAGTGKTSVFNELKNLEPTATYRASITRGFYAYKGITNEVSYFEELTSEEKKNFQLELFDFYINDTIRFIKSNVTTELTFIDRSPIDHLAYSLYSIPDLTITEYNILINKLDKFFKDIKELEYRVKVYEFPYPTPWISATNKNSDDFRYDPFGKTFTISALINKEIKNYISRNKDYNIFREASMYDFNGVVLSPFDRAESIINRY